MTFSLPKWRAARVRFEINALAIRAFDEYSSSIGGKDREGNIIPSGKDFFTDDNKSKEADAWRAAVRTLIYKHPYNGCCWKYIKEDYNGDYVVERKWFHIIVLGWPLLLASLIIIFCLI